MQKKSSRKLSVNATDRQESQKQPKEQICKKPKQICMSRTGEVLSSSFSLQLVAVFPHHKAAVDETGHAQRRAAVRTLRLALGEPLPVKWARGGDRAMGVQKGRWDTILTFCLQTRVENVYDTRLDLLFRFSTEMHDD
jgi:hypothetical protein